MGGGGSNQACGTNRSKFLHKLQWKKPKPKKKKAGEKRGETSGGEKHPVLYSSPIATVGATKVPMDRMGQEQVPFFPGVERQLSPPKRSKLEKEESK